MYAIEHLRGRQTTLAMTHPSIVMTQVSEAQMKQDVETEQLRSGFTLGAFTLGALSRAEYLPIIPHVD